MNKLNRDPPIVNKSDIEITNAQDEATISGTITIPDFDTKTEFKDQF